MFRKALEISDERKYSGKDIKKLNFLLVAKCGESAAFGSRANVFVKAESSCAQLISVKANDGEEFCFGSLADSKAFDRAVNSASNGPRGRAADVDAAVVFPSLHRLWKEMDEHPEETCPLNVAPVYVHPDTSHFVLNGADFMAPGLQGRQYPYAEGAVVALYAAGNPRPFAVGQWQGPRTSGVAVRVFTRFGDALWTRNPSKPEGFLPTRISSLAAAADGASERAPEEVAAAREAPAGDVAAEGDGASEAKEEECPENAGGDVEDVENSTKPNGESSREEMDALLLRSFLQAAKTTLKQDSKAGALKAGPLAIDVFYSQYVRPARPVGSSIDVHKSSYKKVSKFVEFLKDSDLISTDKNGQVLGITRSHPDFRGFELHEIHEATDASSAAPGGKAKASLCVEGIANSRVLFPLHLLKPELNKLFFDAAGECVSSHFRQRPGAPAFAPPPRDGSEEGSPSPPDVSSLEVYIEASMVAPALKDFCNRKELMVSKKLVDVKRLDVPILRQQVGEDAESAPVTVDVLARRVLEMGTAKQQFHKVTTVSLVGEEKVSYRQGAPQRVDIRTEKRKNHNVTTLQGLDARCYGYDLEKLADFFKKKFSVATFLEESGSAKFIVVGGFFDRDLEQICVGELGIPTDCVENLAANRKADMKQRKK